MTLGEYIKAYREKHRLSQRQFAAIVTLSNGYISMLEKGVNPKTGRPITPTPQQLKKIAQGMGMTLHELLLEIDDIDIDISGPLPNVFPLPTTHRIPLIGTIACGTPILATENRDGEVSVPDNLHVDFALRCKGDSMINARIFDGDIVYIRQQSTVENGEIAAVLIGNEATLKRVRLFPDHVVLEAENPLFRPLVYWGEEMNSVHIIGLAVAFTSLIR